MGWGRNVAAASMLVLAFSAAALASTASSARAQRDDVADAVTLHGGARYRGLVVEYEPGVRVVLRLPSGELRTWVAGQFARVEIAGEMQPRPPPMTPEQRAQAQDDRDAAAARRRPLDASGLWPTDAEVEQHRAMTDRETEEEDEAAPPRPGLVNVGGRLLAGAEIVVQRDDSWSPGIAFELDASIDLRTAAGSDAWLHFDAGFGYRGPSDLPIAIYDSMAGFPSQCRPSIGCRRALTSNGWYTTMRMLGSFDVAAHNFVRVGAELDLAFLRLEFPGRGGTDSAAAYSAPSVGGAAVLEAGWRTLGDRMELGVLFAGGATPTFEIVIDDSHVTPVQEDNSPVATIRLAVFVAASL